MKTQLKLHIPQMDCASEAQDIEKSLKGVAGVLGIESVYLNNQSTVTFDDSAIDEDKIIQRIKSATGFTVTKVGAQQKEVDKPSGLRNKLLLIAGGVLLAIGLSGRFLLGLDELVVNMFEIAALLIVLLPILLKAIARFKANPFNTDVLMSTAGIGSLLIGSYAEGAAVLLLYTLAEYLEGYTTDRVRNTTKKLAELVPKRALLKAGETSSEVPVEELKVGDVIIVKPGWRIPIDGEIANGSSSIDQAAVTGESIPVEKSAGDGVMSGTLNLSSSIEVKVTKAFYDSTTSRIIDLVMNAQANKASAEKFVDRFSRYYTPAMLLLAAAVALIPPLLFGGVWSEWAYRALIVIVIACPSAFLISTPVTVLIALTAAMRSGVLIKGGSYLEELARIKVVIFDKTGTLTIGQPTVTRVEVFNGYTEKEVVAAAAAIEAGSTHPLAQAVVDYAETLNISSEPVAVEEVPGKGLYGTLNGQRVTVGKLDYLESMGVDLSQLKESVSGSVVAVAFGKKLAGTFAIADTLRPEAAQAVTELQKAGITRTVMLTGDQAAIAKTIAAEVGVDEYHADLLPQDKEALAGKFRDKYGASAMVGDGINDAPVLAASNVGIAIGTAGNDIALEAADVALMNANLRTIPYLIRHGRKSVRKLQVNLSIALGLKAFMIIGGVLGIVPLWVAVLGDDGATLLVIANALPLLRHTLKS